MELRPASSTRLSPGGPSPADGRRGSAHCPARWALAAVAPLLVVVALPGTATAQDLDRPESETKPPPSYRLSAREATDVARGTDEVRHEMEAHPGLSPTAYTAGPGSWQVSWNAGGEELAQVHVDDRTAAVREAWTGPQVAWKMARGYEGAFGRTLNAPYVWIPLCLVFLAPFVDPRRPFRLLHLDLLVLLAFGASHVFFNRGEISTSVPLVYPVLGYLLVRMLVAGLRPRDRREPLVPLVPVAWLAVAIVFLVGFRVALNVVDSNVIDVGYAGVIGADRIADGEALYEGGFPEDNAHGDTYGPANYLAYVPFEQLFPWSGGWDELQPAHAAAIAFDLATALGLFVLGGRLRRGREGRSLGLALAFAWVSYPYALFALSSNANDSLVAMLIVWALVALSSAPARGALLALAAAAKFAPVVLAPLLARGTGGGAGGARGLAGPLAFFLAFAVVAVAAVAIFLPDGGIRELYERTVGFQAGRDSPFSIWGQEASLGWLQTAVKITALALALLVTFVPRRRSAVQVAALGAAVVIALQLAVTHWFYLYIVWFAPLVLVAVFAPYRGPGPTAAEGAAAPREEPRLEPAAA